MMGALSREPRGELAGPEREDDVLFSALDARGRVAQSTSF